jgi:DNA polymerase I-like protein with 3'-5' exonuclease and polymerase domains
MTSPEQSNALFLGNPDDKPYLSYLKGMFNGLSTYICLEPIELLSHLEMYCEKRSIRHVVSTSVPLLSRLLAQAGNLKDSPSLSNYAGSLFTHKQIEIVFVDPLAQLFTVSYGKFLCQRYISKVVAPESWHESTQFRWTIATPANIDRFYTSWDSPSCLAIAIDIETFRQNLAIRCISYTAILIDPSNPLGISTESIVFPVNDDWSLAQVRRFNQLPAAKIFQNGKYDNSYLLRYNAPVHNYLWDTINCFHAYYSELPKDLAFLNAFFLRKVVYWKDLAETQDLLEYYRYNALDSWATANVWIQWMLTAPDWAKRNYALEFPLVFPCLLAEMTGVKRDENRLIEARSQIDHQVEEELTSLRKSLGVSTFNPNSPKQVVQLLTVLGCKDITSSGEKELEKASYRHPLNARILGKVLTIRGLRKLSSTYLRTEDDAKQSGIHAGEGGAKEFHGRILYALNPHGTGSGRLASKEHHFWTGLQIQNIPVGPEVKQTLCADEGFFLGECDLEQAESRDTGYIAGETKLIEAVSGDRDFHSINAAAFFGRPYDSIYDSAAKKTKNKPLRDIAKRVNHGANYNMGPGVLVDTMGLKNIWEAKRLLNLNLFDPLDIASYLLDQFHATYPKLRGPKTPFTAGTYYAAVVEEIMVHKRLTSRAFHHTPYKLGKLGGSLWVDQQQQIEAIIDSDGDWTRYCFGNPLKNKSDLNSYVSHPPQSLNSRTLNEAWMQVFYLVALPNPDTFRLHAQIHDSLLFSYKHGHEYLAEQVKTCMEIPVSVKDISGVVRTFTVPAALKLGKVDKSTGELVRAKYWSETE